MANPVLEKQFGKPDAPEVAAPTPDSTSGRMTMGSVIGATFFLLLLVAAGAALVG